LHKHRTCFQGKKEAKYLDVAGSEHGMPQHLDREGCLFIVSGIFTVKLADRLKCAKRQWMQQSPVIKLNTIAATWKGSAMTLYPKTLPKAEVTTGRTLSDSSHECIVLHQSLPASHVLIPISGGIMPSEEPPQEST